MSTQPTQDQATPTPVTVDVVQNTNAVAPIQPEKKSRTVSRKPTLKAPTNKKPRASKRPPTSTRRKVSKPQVVIDTDGSDTDESGHDRRQPATVTVASDDFSFKNSTVKYLLLAALGIATVYVRTTFPTGNRHSDPPPGDGIKPAAAPNDAGVNNNPLFAGFGGPSRPRRVDPLHGF